MKRLKLTSLMLVVALASNLFAMNIALADTETVSQAITGGSLTISAPSGDTSLSGGSVSTSSQTVTGTVTDVTVSDTRGTGAGWTASSTMTTIGLLGSSAQKRVTASNITVSEIAVTGTYNGLNASTYSASASVIPVGEYTFTVATVGGSGASTRPATIDVVEPDGGAASAQAVADNAADLTYDGIVLNFTNDADWSTSSVFKVRVDAFKMDGCTVTPSGVTGLSSASTTNVSAQSAAAYTASTLAVSASRSDVVATANAGLGAYTYDLGLSCVLHANPMAGTYNSTITVSIA